MDLRFDDAYEKVYEKDGDAYVFIGTYFAYGINAKMSDSQKQAIVERDSE